MIKRIINWLNTPSHPHPLPPPPRKGFVRIYKCEKCMTIQEKTVCNMVCNDCGHELIQTAAKMVDGQWEERK